MQGNFREKYVLRRKSRGWLGKEREGLLQKEHEADSFPSLERWLAFLVWMMEAWRAPPSAGIQADDRGCCAGPQILRKRCSGEQMGVLGSLAGEFPHCEWKISVWCKHEAWGGWAAWHSKHSVKVVYHSCCMMLWEPSDTPLGVFSSTDICKGMISLTHAWFLHCSIRALNLGLFHIRI